jgi:hypothetical protein
VQELRLYATQKIVRATSLLHLPMIDKRILPPQCEETPEDAAWLQVETKRCASVLQCQATFELGMAKEYERKQQDSVLYGLSQTRKRNSIATLPCFQEKIAAKTNIFGGAKAYTAWKKKAWRMYVVEESPVDTSSEPLPSSEPFSPLLYPPKPVSNVGTRSPSPSAATRSLKPVSNVATRTISPSAAAQSLKDLTKGRTKSENTSCYAEMQEQPVLFTDNQEPIMA